MLKSNLLDPFILALAATAPPDDDDPGRIEYGNDSRLSIALLLAAAELDVVVLLTSKFEYSDESLAIIVLLWLDRVGEASRGPALLCLFI